LALLYNAPRAASIQAKGNCLLFALDRATFNHIVKDAAMRYQNMERVIKSFPSPKLEKEKNMKVY